MHRVHRGPHVWSMRSGTGAPAGWTKWTVPVVVVPSAWAMVDGTGVDSMTRGRGVSAPADS